MMKKTVSILLTIILTASLTGCGGSSGKDSSQNLEGSLSDILNTVYESAELSQDFREAMEYFDSGEIPADSAEYLIGTTEVEYTESIYSMPMMSAVPYQCILLRLPEGADADAAKQTIQDHADPRKWICVEAESIVVENIGNVVLFVMADNETANAMKTAFLNLAK